MARATISAQQLTRLYGGMSSLDVVLGFLSAEGVDTEHPLPSDIYSRGFDCQNLGAYPMLDVVAGVVAEYGKPGREDVVLDVGCGLGGPGRFVADRFACSVVGIELLPVRIEIARELTRRTGLAERITYRVADATKLPFAGRSFAVVWMLDVSMHIRDKAALFEEIARVLRPGGLLVMHEQTGPLPAAMRPVTRLAPYIAPTLPQLIRHVDGAGLRVLTWRDTTPLVFQYFQNIKAKLETAPAPNAGDPGSEMRAQALAVLDGYFETLAHLDGRTGILAARRADLQPRRRGRRTRRSRAG